MSLLFDALKNKLFPWSHGDMGERFIVARKKMSAAQMPDGVSLARRKIAGARVIVKDRRLYGNKRSLKAYWSEAKLGEWDQYKLACILDGRIDFQVGHYAVQCGEGFYLVVPPGMPEPMEQHSSAENSSCDILNIILHSHAVQCFISHDDDTQSHPETIENYLFKSENLATLFRILMDELLQERCNSNVIAANLLAPFWRILMREVEEGHYVNPGPVGRPIMDQIHAGFEAELLHFIQTNLNGNLKLESAARALYLSRTQLVRKMRQETGKTYIEFLTDYRIAEAKVLLRDSDWTISAIAGFLGFSSSAYFQWSFRRETQKTPSEYRKNIQKK